MRSYWVLLLSLSMGPFFICIYFLIMESTSPEYKILIINNDKGAVVSGQEVNHGNLIISLFNAFRPDTIPVPFKVHEVKDRDESILKLKNKKGDALLIIEDSFSASIEKLKSNPAAPAPTVEFIGDITNTYYLISALWANELVNEYCLNVAGKKRIVQIKETSLGISSSVTDFDLIVPGILIVSLIMLMFTASIAFVSEVENRTIIRLKLSKITSFEFLTGISAVQVLVGLASAFLTLITAVLLGFQHTGSLLTILVIAGLTSLSLIGFSLIIAALTKSAGEVLVVGNFPMFLFMFFTGAAFPLKGRELFTIAGYPVNIQGLMSPTHAVSALNKTMIMGMDLMDVVPEILSILILTLLYFVLGGVFFKQRHMRLEGPG
ncbi:MAG: ABC transporter permease [Bacteroidales bacterium]|nr:ABC transporter permease [Bacteroidales bacterium]